MPAKSALKPLSPPPARKKQMQQWLRVILGTLLICVSLSIGSVMGVMARTFNPPKIATTIFDPATGESKTVYVAQDQAFNPLDILRPFNPLDRKLNILILGSDYNYARGRRVSEAETGQRSRTDTIMLASLDPQTKQVSLLSIPRDTRALLTGYHYDKINAAMVYGGIDLVKSTVSDLTGVPIDYYMALKVDGLINMVDVLGGLRIYVEKDMYYVDETGGLGINIHKGWKEAMNGEQANQYVRFRKDELGDIGRVQRQQNFIRAVIDKMMLPQSWLKIPALMDQLNQNIETDIPSDVIGQMVRFGTGLQKEDIRMVMLPGTFSTIGGVSFWEVLPYQARNVITELFPDSALSQEASLNADTEDPKARFRVSVWNATNDLQTGREVIRRLREAGWNVWSIRRAPYDTPVTRLIAQTAQSSHLKSLQEAIDFRAERVTASVGDIGSDFTVLIGPDLVKHYRATLSSEDWQRAERQPMPTTAPIVRQRSRSAAPPPQADSAAPVTGRTRRTPASVPQQPNLSNPAWDQKTLDGLVNELDMAAPPVPVEVPSQRPPQQRRAAPPAAPVSPAAPVTEPVEPVDIPQSF